MTVLALLPSASAGQPQCDRVYNIAHMAITPEAIEWAMKNGANAIEVDLRFADDATPQDFHHGRPCDCTIPLTGGICCTVRCSECTPIEGLLGAMAKQTELALVIVDAKAGSIGRSSERLQFAGSRVAADVIRPLFAKGFNGHLILSVPWIAQAQLLSAAHGALQRDAPGIAARVRYTIDGEGQDAGSVVRTLRDLQIPWVYGTGIFAWWPLPFGQALRQARTMGAPFAYVWTIDQRASMAAYLNDGVDGIMTNRPDRLKDVLAQRAGRRLAKPGEPLGCEKP